MFSSQGSGNVRLSSPFTSIHLAGKAVCSSSSFFFFLEAHQPNMELCFAVCRLLEGTDFDTLAMCVICSCLCGDRMAPEHLFFFFSVAPLGHGRCQLPWHGPPTPPHRHGQRLCQTAPPAQPLFDCPTSVSMQNRIILQLSFRHKFACVCVCFLESV